MIFFNHQMEAGFLPYFFDEQDPRPAAEQLDENYAHGGGVRSGVKFGLNHWQDVGKASLHYPGDPLFRERSRGTMRDETLILFDSDFLAIVQKDGSFIVTRVD